MDQSIKIKADDRELKKARQTIKETFSPKSLKDFHTEATGLEKQLHSLHETQSKLNKEIGKTRQGSDAYRRLKEDLKGVKQQAKEVEKSLELLDRQQARQDRYERMRSAQRAQERSRNLVAGMAQGLGLADYIPTSPGMAFRMAGAGIGHLGRRVGGAAIAPFQMPGLGGLSTMMQGIPLVGQFASGAIQAAAGAYQSAVSYDRARLANLPYAGPQMGQVWRRPAGRAALDQFMAAERAQREAQIGLETAENQLGPRATAAREREQALAAQWARVRQTTPRDLARSDAQVGRIQKLSGGGGGVGGFGRAAGFRTGSGAVGERGQELAQARREVMAATAGDRALAQAKLDKANEVFDKAKAAAAGVSGRFSGLGPLELGTMFGMSPTQVQGAMGQFFGARGGRYTRGAGGGAVQFQEALAAQTLYGISQGTAGGFARMGRAGGGGQGQTGLAAVLQGADVSLGLKGSQIAEYLQELVTQGKRAEQTGVKISAAEFVKTSMSLKMAGVEGPQLARLTGGLNQAAMGLSGRGVSRPMDVLMARAAGFDPSKGPESYAQAMLGLEGGMTQKTATRFVSMVAQGARRGGGPAMQTLLFKRAMEQAGVPVGGDLARKLMAGAESGKLMDTGTLEQLQAAQGGAEGLTGRARFAVAQAAPTAVGAAQLDAFRIGIGRASTWVREFEKSTMQTAQVINNFGGDLQKLSTMVQAATTAFRAFTAGGLKGTWGSVKQVFGGLPAGAP